MVEEEVVVDEENVVVVLDVVVELVQLDVGDEARELALVEVAVVDMESELKLTLSKLT